MPFLLLIYIPFSLETNLVTAVQSYGDGRRFVPSPSLFMRPDGQKRKGTPSGSVSCNLPRFLVVLWQKQKVRRRTAVRSISQR